MLKINYQKGITKNALQYYKIFAVSANLLLIGFYSFFNDGIIK